MKDLQRQNCPCRSRGIPESPEVSPCSRCSTGGLGRGCSRQTSWYLAKKVGSGDDRGRGREVERDAPSIEVRRNQRGDVNAYYSPDSQMG